MLANEWTKTCQRVDETNLMAEVPHALHASDQELPVANACIIGGGAFGTALGLVLAKKGAHVKIWVRSEEQVSFHKMLTQFSRSITNSRSLLHISQAAEVNATHENKKYLPDVSLPPNITWTSSITLAVENAEIVLLALPTQFLRAFLENNRSTLPVGVPLVLCAKGIEMGTLQTPFQVRANLVVVVHRVDECGCGGACMREGEGGGREEGGGKGGGKNGGPVCNGHPCVSPSHTHSLSLLLSSVSVPPLPPPLLSLSV